MKQDEQGTPNTGENDEKAGGLWPKARAAIIVAVIVLMGLLIVQLWRDEGPGADGGQAGRSDDSGSYDDLESDLAYYEDYFEKDFSKEGRLLAAIRQALATGDDVEVESGYSFAFDPDLTYPYVTLYQPGNRFIRRGAIRDSLQASLDEIVDDLRSHRRFAEFDVNDSQKTRILFEIVQSQTDVKLNDLVFGYDGHRSATGKLKTSRFEPGITGLKCAHADKLLFYMPTDATTRSHLSKNHMLGAVARGLRVRLPTAASVQMWM